MAMKINPGAYNVGKPKSLRINGGELHNKAMSAGKSEENTDKIIISAEGAQGPRPTSWCVLRPAILSAPPTPSAWKACVRPWQRGTTECLPRIW